MLNFDKKKKKITIFEKITKNDFYLFVVQNKLNIDKNSKN